MLCLVAALFWQTPTGLSKSPVSSLPPDKGDLVLKSTSQISNGDDQDPDPPFFPNMTGYGWTPPTQLSHPSLQVWTPQVGIEAPETLWVVMQRIRYNGAQRTDCIDVFKSTHCGQSWEYVFSISNGNGGYLSDPVIVIDQRSQPRRVYIAFASQWYWWGWHRGLECASFDPKDPFNTFKSSWVELNYYEEVGSPAIVVERGYKTNYVYCGWNSWHWGYLTYGIRVKRSIDMGEQWSDYIYTYDTKGYAGYMTGDSRDTTAPLVFFVFNENDQDQESDQATISHLIISVDRGDNWKHQEFEAPGGSFIAQSTAAAGLGVGSVIWALDLSDGKQHDLLFRYSVDNGQTWDSYWYEQGPDADTRMPVVKPEGICGRTDVSRYYYLVAYHSDDPASGKGNVLFKVAPVNDIGSPDSWVVPVEADSMVIENIDSYGVGNSGWGQLDVQACKSDAGFFPAIIWRSPNQEASTVLFSTTLQALYNGSGTGESSSNIRSDGFLLNPVSRGQLVFNADSRTIGLPLEIYNSMGQLVKRTWLQNKVDLMDLPSGTYVYMLKQVPIQGRFVLIK